jgi:hypothetical protein
MDVVYYMHKYFIVIHLIITTHRSINGGPIINTIKFVVPSHILLSPSSVKKKNYVPDKVMIKRSRK